MHSANFHLYVEQKLKTGPALAGLTGPTPTALKLNSSVSYRQYSWPLVSMPQLKEIHQL